MLTDESGRVFTYLRLSITDQCNFRCTYCLPNGYQPYPGQSPSLSVDEIRRLVTAFTKFGFCKIRLTGGEPTLRKDFLEIASMISKMQDVKTLVMSTNGYRLLQDAHRYHEAGIQGINVSIDSLNRIKFKTLTGHDKIALILRGVDKALDLNFSSIKINVVLMKQGSAAEIPDFINFIKDKPISVRFIELMPTGSNQELFYKQHITAENLKNTFLQSGWKQIPRNQNAGPAQEFSHPDYRGTMGIIAPYSRGFCESCNRLRITSRGELKLCLFGNARHSLRELLQHDNQMDELYETLQRLLLHKRKTHDLHAGNYGDVVHFAAMGG